MTMYTEVNGDELLRHQVIDVQTIHFVVPTY